MKTKAPMRTLAHEDYLRLREGARIIEADRYGDKVLLLPDDTYVKLFRRKRLLTSATFYPYARRFADNIDALVQRGVPCPTLIALYRIAAIDRDAIHYRPLAGRTLRHIVKDGPDAAASERLRLALGEFVARLHGLGVYFRSLHLGNIVLTPDGALGLIDLADMSPRRRSLGRLLRTRNMKHLLRYPEETAWLCAGGSFFSAYNRASGYQLSP
ncbi:toluene tolerance protein [Azoarcus sp. DD4]|uniref:lipopolysaccharide kinase InaA family protein n=1 Tax=Azoarcus sp. DD4 TaxID=2027405 RepID=UPI0011647CDA|nr:lipopolysaccharide kinase InaA family protein [Azoarcus sp. DD4]QDF98949.1 toluene tolerance protein [Azoarcus sp. DD4]